MRMLEAARRFFRHQSDATAVEYGLVAAGVSLGIISTLLATQDKLIAAFMSLQDALK